MYVHGSCRIIFGASIGLYIILYGPYRVAGCYGALIGFVAFLVGFRVFQMGLSGVSRMTIGVSKKAWQCYVVKLIPKCQEERMVN